MNPVEDKEGMSQEGNTLSTAAKPDGFATIMKRLKGRSTEEGAALKAQADEAVLGYEALALAQEYLERGTYDAAGRWLRVAAGHGVPGAEQALGEMAVRQTLEDFADFTTGGATAVTVDAVPAGAAPSHSGICMTGGPHPAKGDQLWGTVLDGVHTARQESAARAEAAQITEQARREADELLAVAQQRAQAIVDDARTEAEQIRDAVRQQVIEEAKTAAAARAAGLAARSRGEAAEGTGGTRTDVVSEAAQALPGAVWKSSWCALNLPVELSRRGPLKAVRPSWVLPDVTLTRWLAVALVPLEDAVPVRLTVDHLLLLDACRLAEQDGEEAGADQTAQQPYVTHHPWDEDQFARTDLLCGAVSAVGSGPQRLAIGAGHEGHEDAADGSAVDTEEAV